MWTDLPLWRSFGGKLYAVFGSVLILGGILLTIGYVQISEVEDLSSHAIAVAATHDLVQGLAVGLADLDADFRAYSKVADRVTYGAINADIDDVRSLLRALEVRVRDHDLLATELGLIIDDTESLQAHIEEVVSADAIDDDARQRTITELIDHLAHVRNLYSGFSSTSLARVESSTSSQAEILADLSGHLAAFGASIMAILLGASLYVHRSVRSIADVTNIALAIAAGDVSTHVRTSRRDEIGLLAGAFNSMTDQLRDLIEDLEHRVERRTAEILEVNDALQQEITERETTQRELRRSKDFAETVLDSMTESIAIVEASNFRVIGGNSVFTQSASAATAEDLPGLLCYINVNTGSVPCCPRDHDCPMHGVDVGEPLKSAEYVQEGTANHAQRHVEVSISPILDDIGALSGVVHVSRDITQRHLAQESLRDHAARLEQTMHDLGEAQAQLLQAEKLEAIGGLAAGVAHEINTPIQYIGDNARFVEESFTEFLSTFKSVVELIGREGGFPSGSGESEYQAILERADIEFLDEEVPRSIADVLDGVKRVSEIVRALKEFSHPGAEMKSHSDLSELVSRTVAVSRNEWKYVAEVVTEFDSDLPMVPVLSGPLAQALLVLIVNAAQAIGDETRDGRSELGTITIRTSRDAANAVIEVTDNGPGIPEEIRDKVFEHFFTTKEVGTGSGQGLAIARSIIVKQHGGEIDFTSTVDQGTRFRISIPIESVDENEAA